MKNRQSNVWWIQGLLTIVLVAAFGCDAEDLFSETDPSSDSGGEMDPGSDPETDVDTDTESDTDTDAESDTDTESDTDSSSNSDANSKSDSKYSEKIWVGASCHFADFLTIQAAIDAAQPRALIKVCPGTYDEQLEITKSLTIVGVKSKKGKKNKRVRIVPTEVELNLETRVSLIDISDPDLDDAKPVHVHIRNIVLDGSEIETDLVFDGTFNRLPTKRCRPLTGVYYRNASGSIKRSVVRNIHPNYEPEIICASWNGIVAATSENNIASVKVQSNVVMNYLKNGITGSGNNLEFFVRDNVVMGPGTASDSVPNGIQLANNARGTVSGNDVSGNIWAGCGIFPDELSCAWGGTSILLFGTSGVRVARNTVGAANRNVVIRGDNNTIVDNTIFGSFQNSEIETSQAILVGPIRDSRVPQYEGIKNNIKNNKIVSSEDKAIMLFGGDNRITKNQIYGAPIGIFDCADGNKHKKNEFYKVDEETLVCE